MSLGSLFSEKETATENLREKGDGGCKEEWRERKLAERHCRRKGDIFTKEKILEKKIKNKLFLKVWF